MLFNSLEYIGEIVPFPVLVALASVFLALLHHVYKNRNLPPGPRGLPFIGLWPFIDLKSAFVPLEAYQKKLGDIISFKVLGHTYISLGSFKVLREAYITKSDCFAKKYDEFSAMNHIFKNGVFCANGEEWKVLRKFFVQQFKQYGMSSNKDYMAGPIYDTLDSMLHELRAKEGEPINMINLLIQKCSITIRSILFKEVGLSQEEVKEFNMVYGKAVEAMGELGLLFAGESARRFVFPFKNSKDKLVKNYHQMEKILFNIIRKHESTFDESHIRDVIDSYLKEKKDKQKKGDPGARYFTDRVLMATLIQFVGDGVHTLAVLIFDFIQALIEHPEEQEKIYKELIDVIGSDRQPTLDDRGKLPYTNAFFYEVMRLSDIMPFLPSLECTKETTINGYRIPKGAITLMSFMSIHKDPEIYPEPEKFNPLRFLPSDGKPRPELPILFGVGKRNCIGEAYTMTQVFLFVITIIRNFHLYLPKGAENKSAVFFTPGITDICVKPRVNK